MRSLPASWTDIRAPDPFVAVAAGRSIFRLEDLRRLVDLVRELTHATQGGDVLLSGRVEGLLLKVMTAWGW